MPLSMRTKTGWTTRCGSIAVLIALCAFLLATTGTAQAQSATSAPITGEIERLTLTNPNDVWSGGTIVVGGQNIIIPRNLLIDFPANRLTLQQTFAQAPQECLSRAESGLAKADICNTSKVGGIRHDSCQSHQQRKRHRRRYLFPKRY